jgi:hypothetical protein
MSTNVERIRRELTKASESIDEKFDGYREQLIDAAIECIADSAEHDEKRVNINQRYKQRLRDLGANLEQEAQSD